MNKKIQIILLAIALLTACDDNRRINREDYESGRRDREVRKVNEAEVTQKAFEMGDEISTAAQQELMATLTKVIEESGVAGAVEFCNLEALPLLESVGQKYNAKIRRVSNRYRNPNDRPDQDEEMLLSAYEYNVDNDIKSEPNIQKIENDQVLLYTKAITIPSQLCLNCHGDPESDIAPDVLAKINQLYPQDKATGHTEGDLRGMWSIRLPKKEVIKNL
ncbi:DUF3365 domain-containing protein [Litoribacter alkaliphilus]|uniref:DUF3365 domain-containing protein n=1 Tax=Litoribacter ruber TaxID=702568 RepID=A0AAP2G4J3_9BACT|nr:DUF3365 domain-containing protein [Litoribacter alkaliphilus]MBS9523493.1 DUF3365 domain-containing protein [Litoribacter alkaliphilus]